MTFNNINCSHLPELKNLVLRVLGLGKFCSECNPKSKLHDMRIHHQQRMQPEQTQTEQHDSSHSAWELAHSAQARRRNRMVMDAAKNHWFVCNSGIAHCSGPLVYDPYGALVAAIGGDESLAHFNYLWEHEAVKQQAGNELDDFWHGFDHLARMSESNASNYKEMNNSIYTNILEPEITERSDGDLEVSNLYLLSDAAKCSLTGNDGATLQFAAKTPSSCTEEGQLPSSVICADKSAALLVIPQAKGTLNSPKWKVMRQALDPISPVSVLDRLSKHPLKEVREAIAGNPKTSKETFEILMKDPDPDVRIALAQNPHLGGELLEKLAMDEDPSVASNACMSLCNQR